NIGSATYESEDETMDIRGRNLLTGLPETMSVSSSEITGALKESVDKIVHSVKTALEKTPPELSADVMNRGIVMSGGGALLRNISHVLSEETDIPVFTAEYPLENVAIGTGRSLEYIQHFRNHPNVATRATLELVGGRMSFFR